MTMATRRLVLAYAQELKERHRQVIQGTLMDMLCALPKAPQGGKRNSEACNRRS